jgi:hypothetical protein
VAVPLSLEQLFRRYSRYVAVIGLRLLGRDDELDDLVQDVFVAAASGLERLRDPEAIRGYLASATVRLARRSSRWRRSWATPERAGERRVILARGRARFSVTRRPDRRFVVHSGDVEVVVVGTRFVVEREGGQVRVSVEEGKVRVRGPRGDARLLEAGERAVLPARADAGTDAAATTSSAAAELTAPPDVEPTTPAVVSGAAPETVRPAAAGREPRPARTPRASGAGLDWRVLARSASGPDALAALRRQGLEKLDGPDDLLLAADLGRATRSLDLAEQALNLLLSRHPRDRRAPLGAFTLGRLLLEQRDRPADWPLPGPASWRRTGRWPAMPWRVRWSRGRGPASRRAAERAAQYLQAHPSGPHRRAVERHAGPGHASGAR